MRYKVFFSDTNNLDAAVSFQVFLSDTNSYMVTSNYLYLIKVIFLHTVVWFQVTNSKELYLQATIRNTNDSQLNGIKYYYKSFSTRNGTLVRTCPVGWGCRTHRLLL